MSSAMILVDMFWFLSLLFLFLFYLFFGQSLFSEIIMLLLRKSNSIFVQIA